VLASVISITDIVDVILGSHGSSLVQVEFNDFSNFGSFGGVLLAEFSFVVKKKGSFRKFKFFLLFEFQVSRVDKLCPIDSTVGEVQDVEVAFEFVEKHLEELAHESFGDVMVDKGHLLLQAGCSCERCARLHFQASFGLNDATDNCHEHEFKGVNERTSQGLVLLVRQLLEDLTPG